MLVFKVAVDVNVKESITSKPKEGGISKICVAWKVEITQHFFLTQIR